uniref:Uncharacterized protein n=1 Tax=Anguilla anguilla TaxID=7936 RepID=A0A0E9SJC5_ANGAN
MMISLRASSLAWGNHHSKSLPSTVLIIRVNVKLLMRFKLGFSPGYVFLTSQWCLLH